MQGEKRLNLATLVFLVRKNEILLGVKLKKIGKGKRNGAGGGVDGDESLEDCAIRETREEIRVEVSKDSLEKVAVIHFHNTPADGEPFVCTVHVYFAYSWVGEPKATEEMDDPRWFSKNQLPLVNMMLADKQWLPLVTAGKKIVAKARYGPHQQELWGDVEIEIVEELL